MQLVSESTAPPAVINSHARRVSGGTAGGTAAIGKYLWTVFRIVDDFAFTVTTSEGRTLHTSAPEFGTAHKAERAAGEWCANYVAPVEEPSAEAPDLATFRRVEISGYRVEVLPYHRGGFIATATNLSTGNVAMDTIHETENDAMATALAWASANPCDGEAPSDDTDPSTPFDGDAPAHSYSEPGPAPQTATGDEVTSPAPASDLAPVSATPPEPSRESIVDEVWTLLAERDAVDDRLALAEAAKQRAAAQAKEIRSELDELDARIRVARNNAERQRVLPLHPVPRTFAT